MCIHVIGTFFLPLQSGVDAPLSKQTFHPHYIEKLLGARYPDFNSLWHISATALQLTTRFGNNISKHLTSNLICSQTSNSIYPSAIS